MRARRQRSDGRSIGGAVAACCSCHSVGRPRAPAMGNATAATPREYLYIWAGHVDHSIADFLAVIDFDEDSPRLAGRDQHSAVARAGDLQRAAPHAPVGRRHDPLGCGGPLSAERPAGNLLLFDVSNPAGRDSCSRRPTQIRASLTTLAARAAGSRPDGPGQRRPGVVDSTVGAPRRLVAGGPAGRRVQPTAFRSPGAQSDDHSVIYLP